MLKLALLVMPLVAIGYQSPLGLHIIMEARYDIILGVVVHDLKK